MGETKETILEVDNEKYMVVFDSNDIHISPTVDAEHTWEPWQLNLYSAVIESEWNCIDIGANVGINSIVMAHYAKIGKVYSFEPVSITYNLLDLNVKKSALKNIFINKVGLGATNETLTINVSRTGLGTASITSIKSIADVTHNDALSFQEEIKINTLDSWWSLEGKPKIDFIKIDVEGFELEVLQGAAKFISSNPNVLMVCEISLNHQDDVSKHPLTAGTSELLYQTLKAIFSKIFFMGRDSKLYSINSYAHLRLFMMSGHPVDDLFCCNELPAKLESRVLNSWSVPDWLSTDLVVTNKSVISYVNRYRDGWAKITDRMHGTRGAAVLNVNYAQRLLITVKRIHSKHSNNTPKLIRLAINDDVSFFDVLDSDFVINKSLEKGVYVIFLESMFSLLASQYLGNPLDKRSIGVSFSIEIYDEQ